MRKTRWGIGVGTAAAAFVALAACTSDADLMGTPLAGDQDVDASAGAPMTAGGGACADVPPRDPATLPSCCADGAAHCVPAGDVPGAIASHLAACGAGASAGFCVPDPYIRAGHAEKPPHCMSLGGADGVCLSVCIPQVAQYKSLLPQASCAPDERCAPCISPLDKMPTGACDIGSSGGGGSCSADAGAPGSSDGAAPPPQCPHQGPPVIDPSKLPSCFAGGGAHCLDTSLVPPAMRARLAPCPTGLCVPDDFIAAGGDFVPKTCDSLGGDEGRCLHLALPEVAAQAKRLPTSSCKSYERCAPCWDPRDLSDTGACRLSCDPGPARPKPGCPHSGTPYLDPSPYPSCDPKGGAHCLDASLVSPQLAGELAPCAGGSCVPDVFSAAAGRFVPPTCDSLGGGEGRCLHESIPKVAAQSNLPRASCATYERCTPCWSPIDGTDTGACRLSCDPGPARPKYVFADCCSLGGATQGKCVPTSSIPQSLQQNLSQDTCASADLCVPTENLSPSFRPSACSAFSVAYLGYYEGVCLSDCLVFSGLQNLVIKQGDCDDVHQCVPCTTPTGAPTGAPGCP